MIFKVPSNTYHSVILRFYELEEVSTRTKKYLYWVVLGLARTGLIFTGIQEGAQVGWLTQPGQTEQGFPCHMPSCWVPVSWSGGNSLAARERAAAVWERAALFYGLCSAGLFCVISLSVSFLFLFPLFAVLLNCPYPNPPVFCLFLSILLRTPAGGVAAALALLLPAAAKP